MGKEFQIQRTANAGWRAVVNRPERKLVLLEFSGQGWGKEPEGFPPQKSGIHSKLWEASEGFRIEMTEDRGREMVMVWWDEMVG